MLNNKEFYKIQAEFCKFISNPKRLEILFLLDDREMYVDEISSKMNIKVPNISQHLAVMRDRGIVKVRRDGKRMYYRLANPKIIQACILMKEAMNEHMESQIETKKSIER